MTSDEGRIQRAQEQPIVGGLPDVPGILTAIRLTPELGVHLRGLANELLVNDFPGATISRFEREVLATAVSAANDCYFCMDSHAAHATAVAELLGETDQLHLLLVCQLATGVTVAGELQRVEEAGPAPLTDRRMRLEGKPRLRYVEDTGGRHTEAAWARRLGPALEFLLQ